jgi:hypothetical protein
MTNYYFEMTDTYGYDANYSWVNRFKVSAKSLHGALCKLSKEVGFNFRHDGSRYNAKNACICVFDISDDEYGIEQYKFKSL